MFSKTFLENEVGAGLLNVHGKFVPQSYCTRKETVHRWCFFNRTTEKLVNRTMEKLVNGQVLNYLSTNSLFYEHQLGFLPEHSTVTQLCYLSNHWQMALEKGEEIHAVFLDLSKAYDRVSIPGLLYKLSSLGFTDSTMQCFTSFLTNREQRVRVDGCLSLPQAPKSGIPQGTVLGPILLLVYHQRSAPIYTKWVLNIRGWHLYVQDGS